MSGRETLWRLAQDATVGICPPPRTRETTGPALPGPRRRPVLWGSGFLVAPGWVLTCAHVLVDGHGLRRPQDPAAGGAEGADVGVVVDGEVLPGRLAYCMPRPHQAVPERGGDQPGREPYADAVDGITPDLALVALLAPLKRERCVWLTDRPPGEFGQAEDDGGGIIGRFYDATGEEGPFVTEQLVCGHGGNKGSRIKVTLRVDMRHGVSGGPLIDLERGEVIGVVKARAKDGRSGLAVAVSALRALGPDSHQPGAPDLGDEPYRELMRLHDAWHWRRQDPEQSDGQDTWIDGQRELPGRLSSWELTDRLTALNRLGRIPGPRSPDVVQQLVHDATGQHANRHTRAVTWRDGHGMLRGFGGDDDLAVHLQYLARVAVEVYRGAAAPGADPQAVAEARALHRWVMERGQALRPQMRKRLSGLRPAPRAVLLEFEEAPAFYDDTEDDGYAGAGAEQALFTWSVLRGYGDGRWELAVEPQPDGVPFARAREQALLALAGVLAGADAARPAGDPVPLEVALPGSLFGAAVAEWEMREDHRPSSPRSVVGADRPVVLRDIERRLAPVVGDEGAADPWARRWQGLLSAPRLTPVRLAEPHAPLGRQQLSALPDGTVPVLCRDVSAGTGGDAVQRAAGLGFPVALWRADGHGEPHPDPAAGHCEEFHDGVAGLLSAVGPDPAVLSLPRRVWRLRAGEPRAAWTRGLVLFYDDPRHPLPRAAEKPLQQPGRRDRNAS
ncbi:VMAP-C domain-containing protein [Streptomyces purpureus]|uniref:VMAP-C domain-containing protein n=3 Tax=Streptomyces purpureus TaxID=1951 RepID=UPI0035EE58E9